MPPILFIALAGFAYALLSKRLASTVVTAPLFFVCLGLAVGPLLGLVELAPGDELTILFLEAAIGMVLFVDASSLDTRRFRGEPTLAARLLAIGLPLTIVAGSVTAAFMTPGIEPWQAALIGTLLAPTDAALGQAVVANPRVPAVVRNALNVESGVNDGLVLPLVSIFIAAGLAASGAETELRAAETLALALLGSTGIGLAIGLGGSWLLRAAIRRGLAARSWQSVALVSIAVAAYILADRIEASGFLAVWVAGIVTGWLLRPAIDADVFDLPEGLADALLALAFLLVGTALLGPVLTRTTPAAVLYAVLSLTAIRMLPVAIAMARSGFAPATVAFAGWFGPRGLASVVFAGVVVSSAVPAAQPITDVVFLTVGLSVLAHGMTAAWGARRYAAWFERASRGRPDMPEAAEITTLSRYPRAARLGSVDVDDA